MPDRTYTPTRAMQAAARRAKKARDAAPDSRKGMERAGLARMNQLLNRSELSYATVLRMYRFFERHDGTRPDGDPTGTPWKQAWDGWGGDAGWRWSKRIVMARRKSDA